jgi:hypothetical protein
MPMLPVISIKPIRPIGFMVFVMLLTCSGPTTQIAGGGVDVENGRVVGRIVTRGNGQPVANAYVTVMKASANPSASPSAAVRIDTTSATGFFSIGDLPAGTYNLLAYSDDAQRLAWRCSVSIGRMTEVDIGSDSMAMPGSVRIILPDNVVAIGGCIYIPGTILYWPIDSMALATHELTATPVPAGERIPIFAYSSPDSSIHIIIGKNIEVEEEDTTEFQYEIGDSLCVDEESTEFPIDD